MTNAKQLLCFLLKKNTIILYKKFLTSIEDLRFEHKAMLQRLENSLPSQYHSLLRSVDYFDETKFSYIRKKVLDAGNEAVRSDEEQIDKFNINH